METETIVVERIQEDGTDFTALCVRSGVRVPILVPYAGPDRVSQQADYDEARGLLADAALAGDGRRLRLVMCGDQVQKAEEV